MRKIFNTTKMLLSFLISLCFIISLFVIPVHANNENDFYPSDLNAYNIYLDALADYSNKFNTYSINDNDMFNENQLNWTDEQIVKFQSILLKGKFEKSFEELYINTNYDAYQSRVVINDATNDVILIEADHINNNLLILINNEKYKLIERDQDLYLLNEDGDEIIISKTINITPQISTLALRDTPYSLSNDSSFSDDYGPFNSTNTSLVSFLDWVNEASGILGIVHPLFGTINIITTGAGILVGTSDYFTSYIKYWQSFSKSDGTYIREKQRWFSLSSCSDASFMGNNTRYFYTSRP